MKTFLKTCFKTFFQKFLPKLSPKTFFQNFFPELFSRTFLKLFLKSFFQNLFQTFFETFFKIISENFLKHKFLAASWLIHVHMFPNSTKFDGLIGIYGATVFLLTFIIAPFANAYIKRSLLKKPITKAGLFNFYTLKIPQLSTYGYVSGTTTWFLRTLVHKNMGHLCMCLTGGLLLSQCKYSVHNLMAQVPLSFELAHLDMNRKNAFDSWTMGTLWSSYSSAMWGQLMPHTTIGASGSIYGLVGWHIWNTIKTMSQSDGYSFMDAKYLLGLFCWGLLIFECGKCF